MTSSDLTLLPADAKERAATRVGTSVDGAAGPGGVTPASDVRVGLACAEFNGGITDRLLTGALDALEEAGCDLGKAVVVWAPGAFELPVVAQKLAVSDTVDAVICLGAVIRGDTGHYDFVWTVGALLIALAAWVQTPEADTTDQVTGMRAIALALVAQALAIGIQIYALFGEVGKSERVVTVVVLVVASVQIILTRPRAQGGQAADGHDPHPVVVAPADGGAATATEPMEGS